MLHPLQKAIVQAIWWGRLLDLVLTAATDLLYFKFMSAAANKEVCQYAKFPIFFHSQKVFQH